MFWVIILSKNCNIRFYLFVDMIMYPKEKMPIPPIFPKFLCISPNFIDLTQKIPKRAQYCRYKLVYKILQGQYWCFCETSADIDGTNLIIFRTSSSLQMHVSRNDKLNISSFQNIKLPERAFYTISWKIKLKTNMRNAFNISSNIYLTKLPQ